MAKKRKSRYRAAIMPKGLQLAPSFVLAIFGAWAWFYVATMFGAPMAIVLLGALVIGMIILLTLIPRSN